MKVFAIINPHAKRNKKRPELTSKLERIFGPDARVRMSQTLEELEIVAKEALDEGCTLLAICGGDGTIHHTLTRFRKVFGDKPLPDILLLGGGTMNMVAHSVKVLGPAEGIAHRYMQAVEKGPVATVSRETLNIDGRLCFIFGLGLVSNFLNAYYEGGNTGPIKAARVVQRGIWSVVQGSDFAKQLFAPWCGKISVDGEMMPVTKYTAVLVQTIENLGIGFKPMYRAFEKPGHFHAIGTGMTPVRIVNHLPHIFGGKPMRNKDTWDRVAAELVITPDTDSLYTMDGDMYSSDSEIRVLAGPTVRICKV